MTALRQVLTDQLTGRLDRHRVVVWVDAPGEYREIAPEIAPPDATFEPYRGSWYELRRRIESELAHTDPRLVVYVDAEEPAEDPLAEVREAGTRYARQLGTLLRQTLEGELAAARLDEIATTASTLVEAEALLEGGTTGSPALLLKAFGPHEPTDLVLKLATSEVSDLADDDGLAEEVAHFLESHLGLRADPLQDVGASIARHLVLVELAGMLSELPEGLRHAIPTVSAERRHRCQAILHRWKHDQRLAASFEELMSQADRDLALSTQLGWDDLLIELDTVPAYDGLALAEYRTRMDQGRFVEAEDLAAARLASRWVGRDQEGTQLWRAAHAAAQLRRLLEGRSRQQTGSVEGILREYADDIWKIDRAHRRLELAMWALTDKSPVETVVMDARRAYDQWLDNYLRSFTAAAQDEGLATGDLLLQSHVHAGVVTRYAADGPVAYFMVDALRYELAHDLQDALRRQFTNATITLTPAVALVPSITPVGMANLCPGAEHGLSLDLSDEKLVVRIGEREVMTPPDRVARLQAAHGHVADLRLGEVVGAGERELDERVQGVSLVLVRSQEIDEQGETGKLHVGLSSFDQTVQLLARAVARLAQHGVDRFVISADHGFLALTRDVGGHMIIPKPGGRGEVHRRAFVGRGGTADEASLRLPLSKVGLPGDLDVIVPRGLALIAAGGARGFFHGGLSPQEIVVPVLTVEVPPRQVGSVLLVQANLAPKITSQIVTASVLRPHQLLTDVATARPILTRERDGQDVGVLVTAGGAEEGEGLVRLEAGEEVTLGFRVTHSLQKGDKVTLKVLDARTDRLLGESPKPATVARQLEVDDELA